MTTGSLEQRLALGLGRVRSAIRVIDTHVPAYSVNWAAHEDGKSVSFTDFGKGRIALNPLPIISSMPGRKGDAYMPYAEAIEIETGFGLHEGSHSEESRDRYQDLVKPNPNPTKAITRAYDVPAFEPFALAIWLWNIAEDVRIEDVTGRKWPGTRPYFRKVLDWMWSKHPVEIKDFMSSKLEDRLKVVFTACRFPDRIEQAMVFQSYAKGKETESRAEVAWWQAWQADYLAARATVAETIQSGLDHLAEDKKTAQQMAEMTQKERDERAAGEKVRAQLERLLRQGIGDTPVCITADGEVVPLTAAQAAAVDKLVREQLESVKPLFTDNGNHCEEVRVTKPEETADSRRAYVGKPTPLVEALRTALVFRQSAPEWDLKLQKSGTMDDEELWRLATGDDRVFGEHVIENRSDVALGLLIDMSGSMSGGHVRTAQRLAQTFLWAVRDDEGVTPYVWGHTGDLDAIGSDVFRLWEPGDPLERLGLVTVIGGGNNYDGFAIAYCVDRLKDMPQPQKALIVLSDGYPSGSGYGDIAAQQHMRHVCDWAERQGVNVFQVAIDHELRAEDQERMYGPGRWLGYSTDARLPRDLGRLLARLT